ncbi:homoserine O-acetyltransferase [Streptomyces sp. NPDC047072]|uniref:homoserine O-acetyltransferase MetX n=1 Tax=Streptomyces sp. NPDC047072 TaxID=3154809 RepID=UPI00340850F7
MTDLTASGVSTSGLPASGVSASGLPASGVAASGLPASGVAASGLPASGVAASGLPASGVAASGLPASGVSASGLPASGVSASGLPAPGVAASGLPASGVSAPGLPTPGAPTPGLPALGISTPGAPTPGAPTPAFPAPMSRHQRTALLFPPQRPLSLEAGGTLTDVQVAYEEYGRPDPARPNTVFVCHALTGTSHAARHTPDDLPGWWEEMVGPGRPIDTARFHVVCANVVGGCAGTTGPWSPGPAGQPLGADFPEVTVGDMVTVHRELLRHLGGPDLHAVVGGSLGGMQALEWLLRHPGDARRFLLVATGARLSADGLAAHAAGRAAIRSDPAFADGHYARRPDARGPVDGLGVARMIAHLTYMSPGSLATKFGRRQQPRASAGGGAYGPYAVERYLEHQARSFVARFDANSYLRLTAAMDRYDAFARPPATFPKIPRTPTAHLFSFESDRLFGAADTAYLTARLHELGVPLTHHRDHSSQAGHDAFLLRVPGYLQAVATVLATPPRTDRPLSVGAGARPEQGS